MRTTPETNPEANPEIKKNAAVRGVFHVLPRTGAAYKMKKAGFVENRPFRSPFFGAAPYCR